MPDLPDSPDAMDHVYLADSWVLGLEADETHVCFTLDAVLEEGHPRFYRPPKPGSSSPTPDCVGVSPEKFGGTTVRTLIAPPPTPPERRTSETLTPGGMKVMWITSKVTGEQ